jgi:hypothetical protein
LASIPFSVEILATLINDEYAEVGFKKLGDFPPLLISLATTISTMRKLVWAPEAMKAFASLLIISGSILVLSPALGAQIWLTGAVSALDKAYLSAAGILLLVPGIVCGEVAWGRDLVTAIGHGALAMVLFMIKCYFITKETDELDPKGNHRTRILHYMWLLAQAYTAASILL